MSKIVIGIGNKLMTDDGAALFILENIKNNLEDKEIEVIIGETDADFCFSRLNSQDEFYIVDSTCFGNPPGTVVFKNIDEVKKLKDNDCLSHSLGLIHLINIYDLDIKGWFIGIEIENTNINYGLSSILQEQFDSLCRIVFNFIVYYKR